MRNFISYMFAWRERDLRSQLWYIYSLIDGNRYWLAKSTELLGWNLEVP